MLNQGKHTTNNKKTIFQYLIFLVSFVYFAVFRYFVIPSGDDYFWYGKLGTYLMHHNFFSSNYPVYGGSSNGRYLGNLLEIFSMHHRIIAVLAYGIFWTLLIWGIWSLTKRSMTSLILSFLFAFTMQDAFLNNILVWNAGFVNYIPPMALILLYLVIVKAGLNKQLPWVTMILTFFIGVVAGLFVETSTLMQVILAVLVILYLRKNTKLYHITYLLGTIVSGLIMFMHPSYHMHNNYKQVTFSIAKIWKIYSEITHFWLITYNVVLIMSILIAILILIYKSDFSSIKKWIFSIVSVGFIIYYILMNVYLRHFPLNYLYAFNDTKNGVTHLDGTISLIFVLFIAYCIYQFCRKDPFMWLYYLLAGVSFGQMLFVSSPINCRGIFFAYVFMYLIGLKFVVMALEQLPVSKIVINLIFGIILLFLAGSYQYKMYANYEANMARVSDPAFYNSERPLTTHVPYRKFVWVNDMFNQQLATYWKTFLNK